MSNLIIRSLTGVFIVASILFLLVWEKYGTVLLMNLVVFFGGFEFLKMMKKDLPFINPFKNSIYYLAIALTLSLVFLKIIPSYYIFFALLIPALFLVELLFTNYTAPFNHFAYWTGGVVYWMLPTFTWLLFNSTLFEQHNVLLISLFITVWVSDTMAYVTGSLIGKTKLFERVSPNKTWEGFIGAILFAGIVGYFIGLYVEGHYVYFIIRGISIGILGTMGDLIESILKRSMKVKDSGTILPGHGGFLDRFDSVVFASPFILVADIIYFS